MTRLREEARRLDYRPRFSIFVPVYNPEAGWLQRAIDSILSQVYPEWELCLCDDGSKKGHVREVLRRYERLDRRIKVRYEDENVNISGASNKAVELATGEFLTPLDHDDELTPDALYEVAKVLQEHPDADLIYFDEDIVDETGQRGSLPRFKPDWSPDLLLTGNYITHLGAYRKSVVEEVGGFRLGFEGSQDYDLVLRVTERTDRIHHIPKILYHWWVVEGSAALSWKSKPYTHERSRKALQEALERRGLKGSVEDGPGANRFRVRLDMVGEPKVSIVVPIWRSLTSLKTCLEGVERLSDYGRYEVLVANDGRVAPVEIERLSPVPCQSVMVRRGTSFSETCNRVALEATGEVLLFLDGDAEPFSDGWLEAMLEHAQRSEVGAVGAKVLYPDRRILHAGIVLGVGSLPETSVAGHSHQYYPAEAHGYAGTATNTRNYSAVTGACMMLRRAVFEEVGGFDAEELPALFGDVDLCLRLRSRGYLIVYTPYAEFRHHEPESREFTDFDLEASWRMRQRWGTALDDDPYHNPNLSLDGSFNLRADMLRPPVLKVDEERGEDLGNLLKISPTADREALRHHLEEQQWERARDSRRSILKPAHKGNARSRGT